MVEKNSLGIK